MADRRRMRPLLGTFVEIGITDNQNEHLASAAFSRAFGIIERVQALLSFQNPDSELSRLNRSATTVTLHPLSALAVRLARGMTQASGERFNCTVGGAMIRAGVLPNHAPALPLPRGSADDIAIRGYRVGLRRPIQITLDGIAKGLAVDLAAQVMRAAGIRSGWINAGGDLLAFGGAAIPVHRRELDGSLSPLGVLRNGAIASSAVNRVADSRFPGCIVGTGSQPQRGVWSVYSSCAWRADALTKVAALTADEERAARIAALGGEWLISRGDHGRDIFAHGAIQRNTVIANADNRGGSQRGHSSRDTAA